MEMFRYFCYYSSFLLIILLVLIAGYLHQLQILWRRRFLLKYAFEWHNGPSSALSLKRECVVKAILF